MRAQTSKKEVSKQKIGLPVKVRRSVTNHNFGLALLVTLSHARSANNDSLASVLQQP